MQPNTQAGSGINQANVEKSIKGLLLSIGNVLKTNNKLGTGVSIGIKDQDLTKLAKDAASSIVKGDVGGIKKSLSGGVDIIDKAVQKFAKTQQQQQGNQQPNQEGTPGAGVQQLKAAETLGNEIQTMDDSNLPQMMSQAESTVKENENPVSVSALQGITKMATPKQVADAISSMDPDRFSKFVSGLQKDSLDALADIINNKGGGDGAQASSGNTPASAPKNSGGGDNNAEGNLKLGEL